MRGCFRGLGLGLRILGCCGSCLSVLRLLDLFGAAVSKLDLRISGSVGGWVAEVTRSTGIAEGVSSS